MSKRHPRRHDHGTPRLHTWPVGDLRCEALPACQRAFAPRRRAQDKLLTGGPGPYGSADEARASIAGRPGGPARAPAVDAPSVAGCLRLITPRRSGHTAVDRALPEASVRLVAAATTRADVKLPRRRRGPPPCSFLVESDRPGRRTARRDRPGQAPIGDRPTSRDCVLLRRVRGRSRVGRGVPSVVGTRPSGPSAVAAPGGGAAGSAPRRGARRCRG
jgi:hypothetical protein